MAIDRRAFLAGLLGLSANGLAVMPGLAGSLGKGSLHYVTTCRLTSGAYAFAVLDEAGKIVFQEEIAARGHDIALSPDRKRAVVFARRPGRFMAVFDLEKQALHHLVPATADRHFYGHGTYSHDGRLLYATENAFEDGVGAIGIYDVAKGYQRIGEFSSGGIGPHEMALMPDGHTLVIANGGMATHPDYGRTVLNLADMEPSLCYLDTRTGDIAERHVLPAALHQLSIRHLTIDGSGDVWFGCQFQGARSERLDLVGVHRRGQPIGLIEQSETFYGTYRNYVGSVMTSRDGEQIITTSPRGGVAIVWDRATRKPIRTLKQADVCGAAPHADGFVISDGLGGLEAIVREGEASRMLRERDRTIAWDNHMRSVVL